MRKFNEYNWIQKAAFIAGWSLGIIFCASLILLLFDVAVAITVGTFRWVIR